MGRDEMVREKMTPKLGGGSGMSKAYFNNKKRLNSKTVTEFTAVRPMKLQLKPIIIPEN